jgi:hypothetical protein
MRATGPASGKIRPVGSRIGTTVAIGKHHLSLSNLGKVYDPSGGFTKGQVIEYYARIIGSAKAGGCGAELAWR